MGTKSREKKERRKTQTSGLGEHKKKGNQFSPPLAELPVSQIRWIPDIMPEMLWFDSLLSHRSGPSPHTTLSQTLDVLDQYVTGHAEIVLTGRVSSFSLVPETSRGDALRGLIESGVFHHAFPDDFIQGMLLYPECPMRWLLTEWSESHPVDSEEGTSFLMDAVTRLFSGRGQLANQCRILSFNRIFAHGRISIPPEPVFTEIFPRYPGRVTEEEAKHVESVFRAMFAAFTDSPDFITSDWPKHFWRQNYVISACELPTVPKAVVDEVAEGTDEVIMAVKHAFDNLSTAWKLAATEAALDMYAPERDEVLFGLLSRQFRLFKAMLTSPPMWSSGIGRMMLRVMADTQILLTWLIQQNDPAKFQRFRKYSLGKLKLYKLHLGELASELGLDAADIEEELADQINEEIWEELLPIDVGNVFGGTTTRAMADASGLGDLYRLIFNPGSADVHGDWVSLTAYDLNRCLNPLHRFHRLPRFQSDMVLLPGVLGTAAGILTESMGTWLRAYSLENQYSAATVGFRSTIDGAIVEMTSPGAHASAPPDD
jgi:Family of unknown function (DUF5677)